ncbi:MAG TPA: HAMP domain-containing sensor histidine kinase [Steroidobacteraceae bacterium]|nr:HAMP domain-containing sensor histidine kinase [Steroidobacteraceae bacterium]
MTARRTRLRLSLWPQSLFGRLIGAAFLALLIAHGLSLVLVASERERFVLQASVREWSRRIAEVVVALQPLNSTDRSVATQSLIRQPWRFSRHGPNVFIYRDEVTRDLQPAPLPSSRPPTPHLPPEGPPDGAGVRLESERWNGLDSARQFLPWSLAPDFAPTFTEQLRSTLGDAFQVAVGPADLSKPAIPFGTPLFGDSRDSGAQLYDASVRFPDGYTVLFRVAHLERGAPLPRNLFLNIALLFVGMAVALFFVARGITRPLSQLARAADRVGRDLRQPKLAETGALELRDAARAFNTMQDRLSRYLDSRARVLAAMSHDLKTPLTRLRLQVETLDDPEIQARFGRQLDEMESMVHGALALFKGLNDDETFAPVDINDLLLTLQSEFAEMGSVVMVEGSATRPFTCKPQALRRCLTNLLANAVKFGTRAALVVQDDEAALVLRVRDEGPGIPPDEIERVFEPFYRVESSRNRDTGGTGLGLSIARDVAQAHGGSLILRNLSEDEAAPHGNSRGLEAILTLPRRR